VKAEQRLQRCRPRSGRCRCPRPLAGPARGRAGGQYNSRRDHGRVLRGRDLG